MNSVVSVVSVTVLIVVSIFIISRWNGWGAFLRSWIILVAKDKLIMHRKESVTCEVNSGQQIPHGRAVVKRV